MDVVLLTQDQCSSCDDAKAVLERLAGEYPLSVATLDLASEEGRDLAARGGVLFPRACSSTASRSPTAGCRNASCAANSIAG